MILKPFPVSEYFSWLTKGVLWQGAKVITLCLLSTWVFICMKGLLWLWVPGCPRSLLSHLVSRLEITSCDASFGLAPLSLIKGFSQICVLEWTELLTWREVTALGTAELQLQWLQWHQRASDSWIWCHCFLIRIARIMGMYHYTKLDKTILILA